MKLTQIYTIVIASIGLLLIVYQLMLDISSFLYAHFHNFFLAYLIYSKLFQQLYCIQPVSQYHFLLQLLYFDDTAVCNIFSVNTLLLTSSCAAYLLLINLLLLIFVIQHDFGAWLLGISLQAYKRIHGTIGVMTFLQALVHVSLSLLKTR